MERKEIQFRSRLAGVTEEPERDYLAPAIYRRTASRTAVRIHNRGLPVAWACVTAGRSYPDRIKPALEPALQGKARYGHRHLSIRCAVNATRLLR